MEILKEVSDEFKSGFSGALNKRLGKIWEPKVYDGDIFRDLTDPNYIMNLGVNKKTN